MISNWQRRWQPLLQQWVLISARSAARPWSGAISNGKNNPLPNHDPDCYLCPRVVRANGLSNPDYVGAYAFDNDFPSISFDAPDSPVDDTTTWQTSTAPAHGKCRVLCWSGHHDTTLASLSVADMRNVVRLWQSEYTHLSSTQGIANVLIFENKGVEIGVSNLHPHGQIYATSFLTDTATRMQSAQANYASTHANESLLVSLLNDPHTQQHLVVERNTYFSVIVPFAARFAFETWIVPHRHVSSLSDMSNTELDELAMVYQRQVRRYDLLFQRSAPNITLLHNAPCAPDEAELNQHWCFHIAFHPPLRDPEKLKYLAGFESGSNNIVNPVQPEIAAEQLRSINVSEWTS
ncbi:MAG: UDPglucose--hexose-1-phosphate uridylyltransferase [Halioglobus sp.]|jgi:UDPglucose--hexose-1-phosphate uridylyltransferase